MMPYLGNCLELIVNVFNLVSQDRCVLVEGTKVVYVRKESLTLLLSVEMVESAGLVTEAARR